jgi:hypothetical protein
MTKRTETGRMQFGNDWPGVFIRGDDALSYARNLSVLIAAVEQRGVDLAEGELSAWARVVELRDLLASCRVTAAAAAMGRPEI